MRLLLRSLLLVFIALAVVLHLPALDAAPVNTTFTQGAYIPLVKAEKLLANGQTGRALEAFQLAAMRGIHCGREGVFNRIRNRIGWAGKALGPKDFKNAWPFLARYALWSQNFDHDARRVESWTLTTFHKPTVFDYPVILSSHRTVWNDQPEWVTLWLPKRLLPKEKRELFRGYVPGRSATLPHGVTSRLYVYPLRWRRVRQGIDTSLELGRQRPSDYIWYLKRTGHDKWETLPIGGPSPFASAAWRIQDWSLAEAPPPAAERFPIFKSG